MRHGIDCLITAVLQERNIQTSAEWRQQMGDVDVSILEHMRSNIKGGFDEDKHGPRIGFGNLKRSVAHQPPMRLALCSEHATMLAIMVLPVSISP